MGKTFKPMLQVVRFGAEDVIATSGVPTTLTMSGWSDMVRNNLSFTYGGSNYNSSVQNDLIELMRNNGQSNQIYLADDNKAVDVYTLFSADSRDGKIGSSSDNGEYSWISANSRWEKQ